MKFAFLFLLLPLSCLAGKPEHKEEFLPGDNIDTRATDNSTTPTKPSNGNGNSSQKDKTAQTNRFEGGGRPLLTPSNCTQKPPIETYMQISSATSPEPDETTGIYFLSDQREVNQIYHLKAAGQKPEPITFSEDGVIAFSVSPDGKRILITTQIAGDEQYDISLLDPSKQNKVTPLVVGRNKRVESVVWSPDGKWFAYTSNERNGQDMDLYRYAFDKQKSERLAELSGLHYVTDISPDGHWIALTELRSVTDSEILLFDAVQKKWQPVLKHDRPFYYAMPLFTADSKSFFYISDEESGVRQVHLQSIDGKTSKLITREKWEIENVRLSPRRNALGITINEEGYSKWLGFEIDLRGNKIRTLTGPDSGDTVISSFSFSRREAKSFWFSETSPIASSDIWQMKNSRRVQWTQSTQSQMHPECFAREELIHYPSFDKRMIPAFLYRPATNENNPPFLVHVHGGPEMQSRPVFNRVFQYLLQRGFGILSANVRGSLGYGREYTQLDNYKKRMDGVRDTLEGAHWLLSQRLTSAGKLGIVGGSYGGFVVLRGIEVEPELFSVASESVGIADFVTFLKNTKPYRRALREVEYGPLSDEAFLKSISPTTYIDQIKTPLLIFHGAMDPRVPLSESEQIVKALQTRKIPASLVVFPDEGHNNAKLKNQLEQARKMVAFFEEHLKK